MVLSVHITDHPGDDALAILRGALAPGVHLTLGETAGHEYEVLVSGRPRREDLTARPRLHTLIVPWAGVSSQTRALALEFPHLTVRNLHFPGAPVAEGTVALMLAAAKLLIPADRNLRKGDWTVRYNDGASVLLHGKTVLILGYGAIGRQVAPVCRALGMEVLATRRSVDQAVEGDGVTIHPSGALHDLLPRADVLIVALPLTPETEGLIGAVELACLPEGAILVNVGRGPIVDEAALYHALQSGRLRAAGIDVWYNYPKDEDARSATLPSDYPFHELDNVVMSPHRTGHVGEFRRLQMEELAEVLNAIARGGEAPNRVDVQAGY
ncbi:MAG: hydroxyacid dehydrogenase [Anaerolineae bacterium]|nr:hydroxyacid dehydrogenase [Anaerolineae bacterium]